jgi:hypothetical protein
MCLRRTALIFLVFVSVLGAQAAAQVTKAETPPSMPSLLGVGVGFCLSQVSPFLSANVLLDVLDGSVLSSLYVSSLAAAEVAVGLAWRFRLNPGLLFTSGRPNEELVWPILDLGVSLIPPKYWSPEDPGRYSYFPQTYLRFGVQMKPHKWAESATHSDLTVAALLGYTWGKNWVLLCTADVSFMFLLPARAPETQKAQTDGAQTEGSR